MPLTPEQQAEIDEARRRFQGGKGGADTGR